MKFGDIYQIIDSLDFSKYCIDYSHHEILRFFSIHACAYEGFDYEIKKNCI